jgi:hypothetical protein
MNVIGLTKPFTNAMEGLDDRIDLLPAGILLFVAVDDFVSFRKSCAGVRIQSLEADLNFVPHGLKRIRPSKRSIPTLKHQVRADLHVDLPHCGNARD